jgi:hypothetical protein
MMGTNHILDAAIEMAIVDRMPAFPCRLNQPPFTQNDFNDASCDGAEAASTTIYFESHAIRFDRRGNHVWFSVADVVSAVPDAQFMLHDLDEDDDKDGEGWLSAKGVITLATLLPGSTNPDEPSYRFRRWLWHTAMPQFNATPVPSVDTSIIALTPTAKRMLGVISRLNGASLSAITRQMQLVPSTERRIALSLLTAAGLVTAVTENTGGRPATIYHLATAAPAEQLGIAV